MSAANRTFASLTRPVLVMALALLVLSAGNSAPFVKDAEPQSAQWIADIVDHGHWLLPVDYYGAVNRKPPLFYWLAALLTEARGAPLDERGARAVSTVAAAALVTVVLEWTTAAIDPATGWLAALFLTGSYAFAVRAATALTDMLLTALVFAAYCTVYPVLGGALSRPRLIGFGVLLGLAVLTKGPVAVVLIIFGAALFLLVTQRSLRSLLALRAAWPGLLIAAIIAATWYLPALFAGRHEGIGDVFIQENLGHFMPSALGGTGEASRPFYFIAMRLLGGALPLTLLFPVLIWTVCANGFSNAASRPLLFQLALMLAVVIFFSAASAKRDDYILPALPPMAILLAALFTAIDRRRIAGAIRLRDATLTVIALLVLVGLSTILWLRPLTLPATAQMQSAANSYAAIFLRGIAGGGWPFLLFLGAEFAGAMLIGVGIVRRHPPVSGVGLATLTLAATLLWTGVIRPAEALTRSEVHFAPAVRRLAGPAPVYVPHFDPEFSWYYGQAVPPLPHAIARAYTTGNTATDIPAAPLYLVARPADLEHLAPPLRSRLVPVLPSGLEANPPTLYRLELAPEP